MDTVLAVGEVVLAVCVVLTAGQLLDQHHRTAHGVPLPAVALWLVVAVPSILQVPFPAVRHALERDPDKIEHHGQLWRLLTSVVVQDGGVAGTVSNLVILAIVGTAAAYVLGARTMTWVFLIGILWFNLVSLALGQGGAGNSGATFALGTTITGFALVRGRPTILRVLGVLPAVPGIVLVGGGNPHGYALVMGTVIGILIGWRAPQLTALELPRCAPSKARH